MTTPRPPQPPEMTIIERKRRQSIRQAAIAAGISESRWRLLERGYRDTSIGPAPESAPDFTLARMAWAVGVNPDELREARRPGAAASLEVYAAEQEAIADADEAAAEAAARAAADLRGLTARQRAALAAMIAADLRALRGESE